MKTLTIKGFDNDDLIYDELLMEFAAEKINTASIQCTSGYLFFNEMYLGKKFDFGQDAIRDSAGWVADRKLLSPPNTNHKFETTHSLTLNWEFLDQSVCYTFSQIDFRRSFFLIDSSDIAFRAKLQHVVMDQWSVATSGNGNYSINAVFRKLYRRGVDAQGGLRFGTVIEGVGIEE